ncbi:MAG: DUF3467 domain-containing protein [Flexibacter sp. CG_4_10_14_3_um_filter_32_15]|nr:MAG: DUF3467 domain-containing protein [Flexibacter sp. CG_4_10_14_3_um_filter_32_15]
MDNPTNKNNQEQQINIELTEEMAEGTYANLVMIAHSQSEFFLDFVRLVPGAPKAKVQSRIILTPDHTKRLLHVLKDSIDKYEANVGKISVQEEANQFPLNFGGTVGEA